MKERIPRSDPVDRDFIEVTAKILSVLEYFCQKAKEHPMLSHQELSAALPFSKTTVFRIVYSLEKMGYLEKDARARYYLGPKFFALTKTPVQLRRLQSVAKETMLDLLVRYSETTCLGVIDNSEIFYLDVVQSTRVLRIAVNSSARDPVHTTSLGKAILAYLPELEIDQILKTYPLVKVASCTITNRQQLLAELESVRKNGIAIDRCENVDGAVSIASPIFDQGRVIAGLSIQGPAERMEPRLLEMTRDLHIASLKVSRLLPSSLSNSAVPAVIGFETNE